MSRVFSAPVEWTREVWRFPDAGKRLALSLASAPRHSQQTDVPVSFLERELATFFFFGCMYCA
jgi:hypothetical protein